LQCLCCGQLLRTGSSGARECSDTTAGSTAARHRGSPAPLKVPKALHELRRFPMAKKARKKAKKKSSKKAGKKKARRSRM
jgi:hypothetical protein